MTYLERIAAEPPAALIAAETTGVKHNLSQHYPMLVWKHLSRAQANEHKARQAAILDELRQVWRLANAGDPGWRPALTTFISTHGAIIGGVAATRYRLITEHSPERVAA